MHFYFIVNPVAGRHSTKALYEDVAAVLEARGHRVSVHITTEAGCAGRHVAELAPDACDRLVLVGGDGTLREVVNGAGPELPFPVGLVPVGTANLVGRELRMPLSLAPVTVAEALIAAEPWTVDVLRMERGGAVEYAVANVGVGVDADVVHAISRIRQGALGASGGYVQWVAPIFETLRRFRFPKMTVTVDDQRSYRAGSVVVQNAYNYGGLFHLAPNAGLANEGLNVTLLRCTSRRDLFRFLFGAWRRTVGKYKDVKIVPARKVRLQAEPVSNVQADGDEAGHTDLTIEIVPKTLTLLRAPSGDDE